MTNTEYKIQNRCIKQVLSMNLLNRQKYKKRKREINYISPICITLIYKKLIKISLVPLYILRRNEKTKR